MIKFKNKVDRAVETLMGYCSKVTDCDKCRFFKATDYDVCPFTQDIPCDWGMQKSIIFDRNMERRMNCETD